VEAPAASAAAWAVASAAATASASARLDQRRATLPLHGLLENLRGLAGKKVRLERMLLGYRLVLDAFGVVVLEIMGTLTSWHLNKVLSVCRKVSF
jgi:hypothetical protein